MGKTQKLTVNYAIATADNLFAAMKCDYKRATVQVNLTGIVATDVKLQLHQSIDETNYAQVADSEQTLAAGQTCHIWNLSGFPRGSSFKVKVLKGSAAAGTVDTILMLADE